MMKNSSLRYLNRGATFSSNNVPTSKGFEIETMSQATMPVETKDFSDRKNIPDPTGLSEFGLHLGIVNANKGSFAGSVGTCFSLNNSVRFED